MKSRWPYQHTPYLSALPGLAGYGMDVTAGDKPSKLYWVDSLENVKTGGPAPEIGPNCFKGTLWWCWYADQGANYHKWMMPMKGGYAYLGKAMNSPDNRANFDYVGHSAPGAGLFIQTAAMRVRGSNSRIWSMPSWVGDLPSDPPDGFKADQRDAHQGSTNTFDTSRIAHIGCEAFFSMDEAVQFWYATQGISWLRGAICDPLHTPPDFAMPDGSHHEAGVDHGFGHLIGGRSDFGLSMQSLYAHTTDRNPLVAAANYSHINCLHYNHGRPYIGRGEGVLVDDNGDHNANEGRTMQANLIGNVSVKGPEQGDSIVLARVRNVTEGSSGHAAWNSVYGWPSPSSQEGFYHEGVPPNYLKPIPRRSAWPLGLGFDYDGVFKPACDPLNPTLQEGLAFVDLIRRTVGCMPARRYLYEGGINKVCDQIEAAMRGLTSGPQYVNTVEEAGGWPAMPEHTITSMDGDGWWHAPFPVGPDRDEVYDSGFLLDGSSRAGLSKIREWVANQYHHTQGR